MLHGVKRQIRGIGAIARDRNGNILGGLYWRMWSNDVVTIEAKAIHKGIHLAIENNSKDSEIESDLVITINNIRG